MKTLINLIENPTNEKNRQLDSLININYQSTLLDYLENRQVLTNVF